MFIPLKLKLFVLCDEEEEKDEEKEEGKKGIHLPAEKK